ncbi:unnamed protein product, partial [Symbiodinium pilosum]
AKTSKRSTQGQQSPVQTPKSAKNKRAQGSTKTKTPVSTPKSSETTQTTPGAPVKASRKRRAGEHKEESHSVELATSLSQLQIEEPPKKRAKGTKNTPSKQAVEFEEEPAPQTPPCKPRNAKKGDRNNQRSTVDETCWTPPRTSPHPGKTRSSKTRSGGSMKSEIDPEGLAALRAVQDAFAPQPGSVGSCSRILRFED